jgi:CofH subfamily radical SAM domain protein
MAGPSAGRLRAVRRLPAVARRNGLAVRTRLCRHAASAAAPPAQSPSSGSDRLDLRRHRRHGLAEWHARATPTVARILAAALDEDAAEIEALDAATLLASRGDDAHAVLAVADELRRRTAGDSVTYVVNRNINFTNVCVKRCGFCAFSRTAANREGYYLPLDEIVRRAVEAAHLGATEVCIQAGLPPQMDGDLYATICRAIKAELPDIHIHGFSPEEIVYGASRAKCTVPEFIASLVDAGVGSLPGTSAEILDDDVRAVLAPNRLSTQQWLEVVRAAHAQGLRTTATVMYGHCESYEELAAHLCLIREVQRDTGGFTEFVPLSFISSEAPLYREQQLQEQQQNNDEGAVEGVARGRAAGGRILRSGATHRERLLTHAVSRIVLHGAIDNIQGSWVKEGLDTMRDLLEHCGVSDVGGTLMNESISTAAGSAHGQVSTHLSCR